MWAILAAPLIMGNDIRSMTRETLEILTNQAIIQGKSQLRNLRSW